MTLFQQISWGLKIALSSGGSAPGSGGTTLKKQYRLGEWKYFSL